MSNGKVVLGLLAGVAAGAILGILFAPDKGTGTRKKIIAKRDDTIDEMKERFDDFLESISDKFEEVKNDSKHIAKEAREKVMDGKH